MNLIIDVGNSFVKLAVFNGNDLIDKRIVLLKDIQTEINALINVYVSIENTIVSSVGKLKLSVINIISKYFNVLTLDSNTKVPFKNKYSTPKTLGVDRIALVCGSFIHFSKSNVLIIDAGTCVTYDFINSDNEYFGGAISPGLNMRYKSLNNFTAKLPLLSKQMPNNIVGNSTEESIHSGVVFGFLKEIEGVIECYEEKYSDLTVILTGGDTKFLSKELKSSIFANPNFLLEGLNYILQFNLNE